MAELVRTKKPKSKANVVETSDNVPIDKNIPDAPVLADFLVLDNEISENEDDPNGDNQQDASKQEVNEVGIIATTLDPQTEIISVGEEITESDDFVVESNEDLVATAPLVISHGEDVPTDDLKCQVGVSGLYQGLIEDARKCLEELSTPTAPILVQEHQLEDCVEDIKPPNPEDRVDMKGSQEIIREEMLNVLERLDIEAETAIDMKPLTEEELRDLYHNELITPVREFLVPFVERVNPPPSILYNLLTEYVHLCQCVEEEAEVCETLKSELKSGVKDLWTFWPTVTITERGTCADQREIIFQHSYPSARLNVEVFEEFKVLLMRIKSFLYEKRAETNLDLAVCKMKIERFLYELCTSTSEFESLQPIQQNDFSLQCLQRLHSAIEILFHFIRKTSVAVHGEAVVSKLRAWLLDLVAILLKVGDWHDHFFLLSHILRCSDKDIIWAAQFVQCPPEAVDRALTTLWVLFRPIIRREAFLRNPESGEQWVIIDSEGEDENSQTISLTESALIAVFNQIPLGQVLEAYTMKNPSKLSVLKLFTVSSHLIDIIEEGLQQYSQGQHTQFVKRLGKLTRQLINITTQQLELLIASCGNFSRVQVEYDSFFLKAARCILLSTTNWQFLASAPVHALTDPAKWRLFRALQISTEICLHDFERRFTEFNEADQIYLLSSMYNLIMQGNDVPKRLVRCVAFQIFYIGFLSDSTRESSYKSAKTLLASICQKWEFLFSELIRVQDEYFHNGEVEDQSLTIGLWMEIPVALWTPSYGDFAILFKWLKVDPDKSINEVSRCILKMIDFERLPWEMQVQVAANVLTAHYCHSTDPGFGQWTWVCLAQLRLHVTDRFPTVAMRTNALKYIPELAKDEELSRRVDRQEPVAIFIALSCTLLGHSAPLVFYKGFSHVQVLFREAKYEAAFMCVRNMTCMFLDSPESLYTCDPFLALLGQVVDADNSYVKMPKSLGGSQCPGPILRKFASMLHDILHKSEPEYLGKAVSLWLGCLQKLPLWQHSREVVYLMDIICRHAFFNAEAWHCVLQVLEAALPAISHSEPKSPLSSIVSWITSSPLPTMLPNCCCENAPWFAYAAISVEFNFYEQRTTLWPALLQELWENRGKKTSIDATLKKVCGMLKLPVRTSASLAFYRWANQILNTPLSHPLCVLMWQKLMELYLARIPGLVDRGCVGAFFFHGATNSLLLRRLKECLEKLMKIESGRASSYFSTISCWLTEPLLLEPRILVASLPIAYQPPLLNAIFLGDNSPWLQFFDGGRVQLDLLRDGALWHSLLARKKVIPPPLRLTLPLPSIQESLKSISEGTLLPPPYPKSQWVQPPQERNIKMVFRLINQIVMSQNQKRNRANSEGERFCQDLSSLYTLTTRSIRLSERCQGKKTEGVYKPCRGAAKMTLKFNEGTYNIAIAGRIEAHNVIWSQMLEEDQGEGGVALYSLHAAVTKAIRDILQMQQLTKDCDKTKVVTLFFDLLEYGSQSIYECCYVRKHLMQCLKALGKICVIDDGEAMTQLYKMHYHNSFAADLMDDLFVPHVVDSRTFVIMYETAVENCSTDIEGYLSSFNFDLWLRRCSPRVAHRSTLVALIFKGLTKVSQDEDCATSQALNNHLRVLVAYDFPKHYDEILRKLMEIGQARPWESFICALAPPNFSLPIRNKNLMHKKAVTYINKFAVEQQLLTAKVIEQTAEFLCSHWGTCDDLFKTHASNSELIFVYLGMLVQAYIVQLLHSHRTTLVQKVWPMLEGLFSPWLIVKGTGIDVRQPFESEYVAVAFFCLSVFTESVRFLGESLPGCEAVLNSTWHWFTTNFCHIHVSSSVHSPVVGNLTTLPWQNFHPNLQNIESMWRVVNEPLPTCHTLLGNVFVSIDWPSVVTRCRFHDQLETSSQFFALLLHLLVKLPFEPYLRMNRAVQVQLSYAMSYPWYLVDSATYASVMKFVSVSCDQSFFLDNPGSNDRELKSLVLQLLQIAAGYHSSVQYFHPSTPVKRQIFIGTVVKCLANTQGLKKKPSDPALLAEAISNILTDIEAVISSTVPEDRQLSEVVILLEEVLKLLTESSLTTVSLDAITKFVKSSHHPLVTKGFMKCCGVRVSNPICYGDIIESCLESHFTYGGSRDWRMIASCMEFFSCGSLYVDQVLISNYFLLTLYAVMIKRLNLQNGICRPELNTLLQMFATFKPSEDTEPKLILLAGLTLQLIAREVDAPILLKTFCDNLFTVSNERQGGLLSTLGLKKNPSPTIKLRGTCIVACAGITSLMQSKYEKQNDERFTSTLEKIENNKAFQPILAHLLAARTAIAGLKEIDELVSLVYSLAAQVYDLIGGLLCQNPSRRRDDNIGT